MSKLSLDIQFKALDNFSPAVKEMIKNSEQMSSKLSSIQKDLDGFSKNRASIEYFQKLKDKALHAKGALEENNKVIKDLKQRMNEGDPDPSLNKQLKSAEKLSAKLSDTLKKTTPKLLEVKQKLNMAGYAGQDLSKVKNDLIAKSERHTASLKKEVQAIEKQAQAQQKAKDMAEKMAVYSEASKNVALAGAGVLGGLGKSVQQYVEAENAEMTLKVSMMTNKGEVAKEFNEISALAQKLGTKLPGSTAEFQAMMSKLVQQGISFKAILGGVGEAAAYLGVGLKLPFEEAAEFAAKLQDATRTAEGDMLSLMDVIQKSFYLGVDKTNMLSGFSKLAAGMKTIKQEGLAGAKAMAPLLIMADQASMSGESAGNAYSKIFKAMMDTGNIAKSLDGTGLSLNFTDGKGEFGGLDNMFAQLEKLKGLSTEARLPILSDIWGNDAETIQALNLLIDKGKAGYEEVLAKMEAQASLQQRVDAQLGTLANLWDTAKAGLENILVNIGEALAPHLKTFAEWISQVTDAISSWIKENPALFSWLVKITAGIALVVTVVAGLAFAILSILGPIVLAKASLASFFATAGTATKIVSQLSVLSKLTPIFSVLKVGILGIGKAFLKAGAMMLANPMILAITAVVAVLAGVGYLIYKNWDIIKAKASELWASVKNAFATGVNFIKGIIQRVDSVFANNPILNFLFPIIGIPRMIIANWGTISTFFSNLWTTITTSVSQYWNMIKNIISSAWNSIVSSIASAVLRVKGYVVSAFIAISNYMSSVWTNIRNIVQNAWNNLCNIFKNSPILNFIQNKFGQVKSYLIGLAGQFVNIGRNIVDGLIRGVEAGFAKLKSVWAKVNSYMPSFSKKTMDIHSPSRVFRDIGGHIMGGWQLGIEKGFKPLKNSFHQAVGIFDNPQLSSPTVANFAQAEPFARVMAMPAIAGVPQFATPLAIAKQQSQKVQQHHKPAATQTIHKKQSVQKHQAFNIEGDHINIHIHTTAEQKPQDIAQQIRAELQRYEQQKQLKMRTNYFDNE